MTLALLRTTTICLKRAARIAALAATLVLMAAPALAEAPMDDLAIARQQNVRRLILLNECIGCDLYGTNLTGAHLIGADLRNANLQFANLSFSNLEGADLTGANLTGANLTSSFLTNAYLVNAQLDNVNFTDAHLYYVDVTGASTNNLNLTGAQLYETPIYVGGEEQPAEVREEGDPLETIAPFEEINPAEDYQWPWLER